jgi:cell division protein FtsL
VATAVGSKISRPGAPKKRAAAGARPRPRRQHYLFSSILAAALVSVALLYVWVRLQVVHMGYVLSTSAKLQNQLEQENRELRVELATLTSPDRLEAMARGRLGLTRPQRGQVIVLP